MVDHKMPTLSKGNEDQGIVKQLDLSDAWTLSVFMPTNQPPSLVKSDALHAVGLSCCEGLGNHHAKDIRRLIQLRHMNIDEMLATDSTNFSVLLKSVSQLKIW